MDVNNVVLTGVVMSEPGTRVKQKGWDARVEFQLFVVGHNDQAAAVARVLSYGRLGELVMRYLNKGSRVLVEGRLGQMGKSLVVKAGSVQFLSKSSHGSGVVEEQSSEKVQDG